jgi:hypothetical protein
MVQFMFLRIFSDNFPRFICFVMEEIVEPIFTETSDKIVQLCHGFEY